MKKRNHTINDSLDSTKICSNCYTTTTCMWRKYTNNSVLCNPCGVYYNRKKCHKTVFNNLYYAEILIDLHNKR